MVNDAILNYLEEYKGKYPLASLKEKVLSKGYSLSEFNEANQELISKESPAPSIEKAPSKKGGFAWIRFGGALGLFILVISTINFLIQLFFSESFSSLVSGNKVLSIFLLIFSGLVFIMGLFYLYSFVRVGRYTGTKSLKVASWSLIFSSIAIVLLAIASVLAVNVIISNIRSDLGSRSNEAFEMAALGGSSITGNAVSQSFGGFSGGPWWVYVFLVVIFITLLVTLVMRYIFSISLIRIRSQVKFSLVAGILGLIGTIIFTLYFLFIGYFVINPFALLNLVFNPVMIQIIYWVSVGMGVLALATLFFEDLVLFSASKKYEM